MFKWLTTTKKGYTLVELMIVLVLLSLGAVALMNLFRVGYRAFDKSEERYIKQEEVKRIADILRDSEIHVTSAKVADIFNDNRILPQPVLVDLPNNPDGSKPNPAQGYPKDITFSYLYCEPVFADPATQNELKGYKVYCLNRGMSRKIDTATINNESDPKRKQDLLDFYDEKTGDLKPLTDEPILLNIEPLKQIDPETNSGKLINTCGVNISIVALEGDAKYVRDAKGNFPSFAEISDDIFYQLDVAYHFPNMITQDSDRVVNYTKKEKINSAPYFNAEGKYVTKEIIDEKNNKKTVRDSINAVDKGGTILRVYSDSIITGDALTSKVEVPSLCFIATASYGHGSGEVGMLCDFRDKCLLTNPLGTAFVKAYYAISPPIADFIAENETLKAAVRVMLKPLIVGAEYALNPELRAEGAICLIAGLACLSGATITLITVDKRRRKEKRKASK